MTTSNSGNWNVDCFLKNAAALKKYIEKNVVADVYYWTP